MTDDDPVADDAGAPVLALDDLDPTTLAVRDLIGASRQLVGQVARTMGMNATDVQAIGELVQHGPLGAAALAERLGIRSASATALVDRLERAGHVERVRDTVDRRRVTITGTPAAQRASLAAWAPLVLAIDAECRALPAADREVVRRFLTRVTDAVEHVEQGGAGEQGGTAGGTEPPGA